MPKHQNIRSNNLISHLSNFQKSERGRDLIFYLSKQKIKKKSNLIFLTSKKIKNPTRYYEVTVVRAQYCTLLESLFINSSSSKLTYNLLTLLLTC